MEVVGSTIVIHNQSRSDEIQRVFLHKVAREPVRLVTVSITKLTLWRRKSQFSLGIPHILG